MTGNLASTTRGSVRALLANLIDYAGLFPPAELDMGPTVANYASYLAHADAWMLERLIVPVARLHEFETHAANRLPDKETEDIWPISALTRTADDPALPADLERIEVFNRDYEGRVVIDVIELKAATPTAIDIGLDEIPETLFPFFEIPVADDPRGLIAALAGGDAGAKIRTGGLAPEHYPTPEVFARFLTSCAGAGVAFKATAGLHHPVRHHCATVGADEFGFLGVFVAAALAWHRELDQSSIMRILERTDADAFTFTDDCIIVDDHVLSLDEIEDARLTFAISFGSCSFDEPRDDLRKLGLLASDDRNPTP